MMHGTANRSRDEARRHEQQAAHRYDMSVGIKATHNPQKQQEALVIGKQESNENRSMRKTVTIGFQQHNQDDQLTNSAISVDDQDDSHRVNEEVQTTGSLDQDALKQALEE